MDRVLGAPSAGGTPLDHYDLGYDEGSATSFGRKVFGPLLDGTFAITRWLVSGASMLVEWAFRFTFADALARPAGQVAAAYQSSVVTRLGLTGLAWFAAMCWCGFHALRGRLTKGMGELAVSFVLAVITVTFFASPSTTLLGPGGALDRTRQVSLEVADATTTAPGTPAGGTASGRLTASLRTAFVEQPHQMLDWGVVLDDGDPAATPPRGASRPACLAAYRSLIASGPHGADDEPRTTMTNAGCEDLAKFNHDPTPDRLVAAVLVLVAAVLVCLLMVMVAATLAAAQLGLAALVVLAPFAFCAGIVPGGGRSVLIRWAAAAAKSLAAVVMTSVFLGLLLVSVAALVTATNGQPLLIRMGVLDLIVVCAFVARSRLLKAGKRAATNAGRRLEGAKVGGAQGRSWMGPAAVGGAAGLGASELGHELAAQVRQVPDKVGSGARRLAAVTGRGSYRTRVVSKGGGPGSGPSRGGGPGPGTGPSGPAGTAPGGPGGSAATAAGLRARLGNSRSGRAVRAGGAVAAGAVKLGLASTVGAPVYLPRATKAAKGAAQAKKAAVHASAVRGAARARTYKDEKVGTARAFKDEYAGNVRAAGAAATWVAVRADAGAAKVVAGAARVAAPARRAGANAAQAARTSAAGTKVAAGATRVAAPARRAGEQAAQAARASAAAHAPGRRASQRRAGEDLGRGHAAEELRRRLDSRRRPR